MSITTTSNRSAHAGDGSTVTFAHSKRFLAAADLKVYVVTGGVPDLKALTTDYSVAGVGDDAGGSITFTTAPASGASVIILTDPANTQLTEYTDTDPFPAESTEDALDKLTLEVQALREIAGRSVTSDVDGSGYALPAPAAGMALGWNDDADALTNVLLGSEDTPFPSPAAYNFLAWDAAAAEIANARTAMTATSIATLVAILNAGHVARLDPSQTYTFSAAITIPDGAVIVGSAPVTYTGSETATYITIGDNVVWEDLDLTAPGAVGASGSAHILIGSGYRGRRIRARATTGTSTGALLFADADFRVDEFDTEGYGRPIILQDITGAEAARSGAYIGYFRVRDHIRAFRSINYSDWVIGFADIADTHPSAVLGTAGQNPFLITGGSRWHICGGRIAGAPEHAIRVAGDAGAAPADWSISNVTFVDTYLSAIKINADLYVNSGRISNILCVNSRASAPGNNGAVLRLSHCKDIVVDGVTVILGSGGTYTFYDLLRVNDVDGITVRNVKAEGLYGRVMTYDADQDIADGLGGGPCKNILLSDINVDLTVSNHSEALATVSTTAGETFGNFLWIGGTVVLPPSGGIYTRAGTGGLEASTERAIRCVHFVSTGATPTFSGADVGEFSVSLDVNGVHYAGRSGDANLAGKGQFVVGASEGFSALDVSSNPAGLFVTAPNATSGSGAQGPALVFSRVGSSRRGAAIVATQATASGEQMRLDFYAGSSATATDALIQAMWLNYNGVMNLVPATSEIRIAGTKVLDAQQAAIADLAGGATLADVIAKMNAVLAMLRNMGIIAT